MGDALQDLARLEGLPPRDSILARTLLRHAMVDASGILEAARATARDPSGGGILQRLIASGVLSQERARKLEASLQKRIAQRNAALAREGSGAPGPRAEGAEAIEDAEAVEETEAVEQAKAVEEAKALEEAPGAEAPSGAEPEPARAGRVGAPDSASGAPMRRGRESRRMWKRRSPRPSPVQKSPGPKSKSQVREIVDAFVKRFVCSRTHQLVLESLARSKAAVADPKALARELGVREKEILRVLKDWRAKGLLRTVGTFPFYYEPAPKEKEAVRLFLRAWRDPAGHGKLLATILEIEGG